MPGFLQKFAKTLPLFYVNEGLRAAMVFEDNMAALRDAAIIGVFAAVVFILASSPRNGKRTSDRKVVKRIPTPRMRAGRFETCRQGSHV